MVYNKDHFFENVDAKSLRVGDYVSVCASESASGDSSREHIGTVVEIEDLG